MSTATETGEDCLEQLWDEKPPVCDLVLPEDGGCDRPATWLMIAVCKCLTSRIPTCDMHRDMMLAATIGYDFMCAICYTEGALTWLPL